MSGRPDQKRSVPLSPPLKAASLTELIASPCFTLSPPPPPPACSYIGGGADAPASNPFTAFWRSEITNPEKAPGNVKYVPVLPADVGRCCRGGLVGWTALRAAAAAAAAARPSCFLSLSSLTALFPPPLRRIAVSTALFAGAIILTRTFGDYLVPAF